MRLGLGKAAVAVAVTALVILGGCQQSPKSGTSDGNGKSASLRAMEQVATAAHKCWFASKDPAFKSYRFANELNSMSGQPRFLLVPAKNYGGLPALVVQAQGSSSKVEVFGPLMNEPLAGRINADITRWSSGDASCGANA